MMFPPIGLLAFIQYYGADQVKVLPALVLGVAFMARAWAGA
jgi:hypothetical protein